MRIVGARVGAVKELERKIKERTFGVIKELEHAADTQQAIDAHERKVYAEVQVEQVERSNEMCWPKG